MDKNPHQTSLWRLSIALILSLFLNIGLIFFVVNLYLYSPFSPKVPHVAVVEMRSSSLAISSSLPSVFSAMRGLSFSELMKKIDDPRVVDEGISVREIALSFLADTYYFDIDTATNRSLEKKSFRFQEDKAPFPIYIGVVDEDIGKIQNFAQKEKWPFTSEGLYRLLNRERLSENRSLQEAFFFTPLFQEAELLFSRGSHRPEKGEILELLLGASWGEVQALTSSEKGVLDLSDAARREFLFSQAEKGSQLAATLFLRTDFEFATRKLEDKKAIMLLKTASEDEKTRYALALSKMPRSQSLAKRAAVVIDKDPPKKMVAIVNSTKPPALIPPTKKMEMPPLKKGAIPSSICVLPKKCEKKVYVVCENDSIWKIAKRFSVTSESIKKENRLSSDRLKPGMALTIPSR